MIEMFLLICDKPHFMGLSIHKLKNHSELHLKVPMKLRVLLYSKVNFFPTFLVILIYFQKCLNAFMLLINLEHGRFFKLNLFSFIWRFIKDNVIQELKFEIWKMCQIYTPFYIFAFSFTGFAIGKATERVDAFRKVCTFFLCWSKISINYVLDTIETAKMKINKKKNPPLRLTVKVIYLIKCSFRSTCILLHHFNQTYNYLPKLWDIWEFEDWQCSQILRSYCLFFWCDSDNCGYDFLKSLAFRSIYWNFYVSLKFSVIKYFIKHIFWNLWENLNSNSRFKKNIFFFFSGKEQSSSLFTFYRTIWRPYKWVLIFSWKIFRITFFSMCGSLLITF